eukprot:5848947-Pyramimonas_sp.AAC.1
MARALQAANIHTARRPRPHPSAVNDSRERRGRQPLARQTTPTLRLPTRFSQRVECEILRYKDRAIIHLICRAS